MLQTYEASLEPNGQLRFVDAAAPASAERRDVLVTFLPKIDQQMQVTGLPSTAAGGWQAYVGMLKDSPRFAGEPLAMQRELRNEWR
jgi:hypothetical protein